MNFERGNVSIFSFGCYPGPCSLNEVYDKDTDSCSSHLAKSTKVDSYDATVDNCQHTALNGRAFYPDDIVSNSISKKGILATAEKLKAEGSQEPIEFTYWDGRHAINSRGERQYFQVGGDQTAIEVAGAENRTNRCTKVTVRYKISLLIPPF